MLGLGLDTVILSRASAEGTALPPPFLETSPQLSGSGEIGTSLLGTTGSWLASADATFAWFWQRDGIDIPGASGTGAIVSAYLVSPDDAGATLRLRVTASDFGGSVTAFSAGIVAFYTAPVALGAAWSFTFAQGVGIAAIDLSGGFSGTMPVFGLAAGSDPLPAGLSLSPDGFLSGSPSAAGSAVLIVEASNPAGTAQRQASLNVVGAALYADYAADLYQTFGGAVSSFAATHSYSRTGSATRLDAGGAIETLATDTARFDHDAAGTPLGLLIEPEATNRLLDSEATASGWSLAGGLTTAPAGLSVRGRWAGLTLRSAGNSAARLQQFINVTAGEPVALQLYCLPGSSGRLFVQLRDQDAGQNSVLRGALGNLAVTSNAAGSLTDISQEVALDGVYHIGVTLTPDFSGSLRVAIGPDSSTSGETVVFLAAQTAGGSYIPTSGAAVTRGEDTLALTGLAAGAYDLLLDYDDANSAAVTGFIADAGAWPPVGQPHLKRLSAFPAAFETLALSNGVLLRLQSDRALYLESPA
ncbi:MAG: putative Ig domain-containing protein [Pseudomonadota bacterium]